MAGASVSIRVVFDHVPQASDAVHAAVVDAVAETAYGVEARGKQLCPVDTGTLRRSIHTVLSKGGLRAVVGPSADYAEYVEFGTRYMAARPYMRPAAASVLRTLVPTIRARLGRIA